MKHSQVRKETQREENRLGGNRGKRAVGGDTGSFWDTRAENIPVSCVY